MLEVQQSSVLPWEQPKLQSDSSSNPPLAKETVVRAAARLHDEVWLVTRSYKLPF